MLYINLIMRGNKEAQKQMKTTTETGEEIREVEGATDNAFLGTAGQPRGSASVETNTEPDTSPERNRKIKTKYKIRKEAERMGKNKKY